MSTGTALVHPSTAKLTPAAQAKGTYVYTPPEVLGYLNGDTLSDVDMAIVTKFFNGNPPALQTKQPDPVESFNYQPQVTPAQRRVLTKKRVDADNRPTPLDAAYTLADALDDDAAYSLLCRLASRFDFDIE